MHKKKGGLLVPPKMGRPISGESRKDLRLNLRLSKEEMALIDECADKLKETRIGVVMKGVRLVKKELDEK